MLWSRNDSHAVAGMFVTIFEGELGDAGFVEFAEAFGDHAVVLFLRRARERQVEAEIARKLTPRIVDDFNARESVCPCPSTAASRTVNERH
jgi:hypothetical protein